MGLRRPGLGLVLRLRLRLRDRWMAMRDIRPRVAARCLPCVSLLWMVWMSTMGWAYESLSIPGLEGGVTTEDCTIEVLMCAR